MGKVIVSVTVENLYDLAAEDGGTLNPDQVRRLAVKDALVDSGATGLLMPKRMIAQLGLAPLRIRKAKTAGGVVSMQVYRAARLTVHGQECILDVTEIGDDLPVKVGRIPLTSMDWVIDIAGQKLIGDPAHGGEQMIEVY